MTNDLTSVLTALYNNESKHSHYQNIPPFIAEKLGVTASLDEEWRGDTARIKFLESTLNIPDGAVVGDVGANTGFFTLSLARRFPNAHFLAYECNAIHADFIRQVVDTVAIKNITVHCRPLCLANPGDLAHHDYLLHLNVLHHAGGDFDKDLVPTRKQFKDYAVRYLSYLRNITKRIVFSMGYNWRGNKEQPLICLNDDIGKFLFTREIFDNAGWVVDTTAHAQRDAERQITYTSMPTEILRLNDADDSLRAYIDNLKLHAFSEFYRRPIIMASRVN